MTGNKSYLSDYEEINGGLVAFRGDPKGGKDGKKMVPDQKYILLPLLTSDPSLSKSLKDSPDAGLSYLMKIISPSRTRIVEENHTPNIVGNGRNWLFDIDALTISMNYKPVVTGNQTNGNAGTKENIDACQDGKKIVPDQEYILLPLLTFDPSLSKSSKDSLDVGFKPSGEEEKMDLNIKDCNKVGVEADMNNLATTMPVSPIPTTRVHKYHPLEQIIRDIHSAPQTRRMKKNVTEHKVEPKKVWTLVELPYGKRAIGTKWVYKNKKDDRGIVVRNKARLVAQDYTQEEGIDYDEVFVPVARIEKIRLFLAYASFMNFIVYQMDLKSAFLYGIIEEEVYVCQPPGFEDPEFPNKFYKVEKAFYGLHQAPRAWVCGNNRKDDGIFISQDKYVADILKKFDFATVKTASTPIETNKALLKDEEAADVDVHLYRSMIRSLMYLTASRPDIMFAVCVCARDSPFDLEAFFDSDYAGASLDRKSTTGGCQFLGRRLISPQRKKHTIVANSTTKLEYVAAANCCRQVLWIQNQLLDYGYNFMNTKIFIDNESTICIVKNPVFHSKTKHIEIRHHFIRDSYEKRLIQVIKIHTDHNVADLLTKAFDTQKPRKAKRTTEISQSSGPIPLVTYETVIKEWEDRMERAATTASSLEAEQDSGSGPRCQDTILGVQKLKLGLRLHLNKSYDPPLSRVNTLGSREDIMKLKELMEFCTKLSVRALDL
ncbi:putative reverse transcriptase, RNA-dependent DNA polymerase [Tanacetum coccineum]